jgi:hypothetical protein
MAKTKETLGDSTDQQPIDKQVVDTTSAAETLVRDALLAEFEPPPEPEPEPKPPEPEPVVAEDDVTGAEPEEEEAAAEPEEAVDEPEPEEPEPTSVQKRIDQLTRQKREAQERADALAKELEEAKAQTAEPAPPIAATDPWGLSRYSETQLHKLESDVTSSLDDIEEYLDGIASDSKVREVEAWMEKDGLDESALKIRRRDLRKLVAAIPQRKQFMTQEHELTERTKQLYPSAVWWEDKTSNAYTLGSQMVAAHPEIKRHPDWRFRIGAEIIGLQVLYQQAQQNKQRPVAKPKPPSAASKPAAAPKLNAGRSAQLQAAREAAKAKHYDPDSTVDWVKEELLTSLQG